MLVYARPVLSLYQIRYTGAASQSTAAVRNSNISASTSTSAASSPRCQGESRGPEVKVGDTKNVVLRCRWNSTSKKWISLGSGGSVTSSSTKFACTFKCTLLSLSFLCLLALHPLSFHFAFALPSLSFHSPFTSPFALLSLSSPSRYSVF